MDKIITYFVEETAVTEVVAKVLAKPLYKYEDIQNEFIYWLDNRTFDSPNAITCNGYSAGMIHEMAPYLDAAGVYSFMVTLRDYPEKADEYMKNGFPQNK